MKFLTIHPQVGRPLLLSLTSAILLTSSAGLLSGEQISYSELRTKLKISSSDIDRKGFLPKSMAPVVEKVQNSVVSISSGVARGNRRQQIGVGSGVIITEDGYLLTNSHVVEGANDIIVKLTNERKEFKAALVGRDPSSDIAILKVEAKGLKPATLSDSRNAKVGDFVLAIGNPFDLEQTVTSGLISGVGRTNVGIVDYANFIQTDASINPGNSGGALIDVEGRLVGINTAISSRTGGSDGIGFAIPVNSFLTTIQLLLDQGKVTRGFLGIGMRDLSSREAELLQRDDLSGSLVDAVVVDSPADKAGLKVGDVVTAVNGKAIRDSSKLRLLIGSIQPGKETIFTVERSGKLSSLKVKLSDREKAVSGGLLPVLRRR